MMPQNVPAVGTIAPSIRPRRPPQPRWGTTGRGNPRRLVRFAQRETASITPAREELHRPAGSRTPQITAGRSFSGDREPVRGISNRHR